MRCQRCGAKAYTSICSMFNTEQLCLECSQREQAHPDYEKAAEAESQAVRRGDYNYPGIGLPPELRR